MISATRPTKMVSRLALGLAVPLSLLLLTACSAEADTPATTYTASENTGTLETAAGVYKFTPTSCAVYREDGFDDIEIEGPGTAPDGEKFYFELSSTANAMTVKLGVDSPFTSPERQLKAGRFYSQEFTITASDGKLSASGLVLVNGNGEPVDGDATLAIACGA